MLQRKKYGNPVECNVCYEWLDAEAFLPEQRHHSSTHTRVCFNCLESRRCVVCKEKKYLKKITTSEWIRAGYADNQGKCNAYSGRSTNGI